MDKNLLRLAGGGLILLGIMLIARGAGPLLSPDSFEAFVRLTVDKDTLNNQISRAIDAPTSVFGFGSDAFWIQNEFEIVNSKTVLYRVITNLNLNRRWAVKLKEAGDVRTEATYALLKKQMDVRETGTSRLLEIRVKSEDKYEAVAIANEIATAYRDSRLAMWRARPLTARKVSWETGEHSSPVKIIDLAEPPQHPAYPNRYLASVMVLGGFGAVFLGTFALTAERSGGVAE